MGCCSERSIRRRRIAGEGPAVGRPENATRTASGRGERERAGPEWEGSQFDAFPSICLAFECSLRQSVFFSADLENARIRRCART